MSTTYRKAILDDVSALKEISARVIRTNYSAFLGIEMVDDFIESGLADKEIDDGLNVCTVMANDDVIIGFVIVRDDLLHLLRLSDWRNIAYHHTYRIENASIICTYGKPSKTIELSIKDLGSYCHQIIRASNVMNIARCIFAFDNLDEILSMKPQNTSAHIVFRKPLLIEQLKISLLSQGFKLGKYTEDNDIATIFLFDQRNDGTLNSAELQKRRIHSSQLLYNVWAVFRKKVVRIVYCTKEGEKAIVYTTTETVCNKVHKGEPIAYMAKNIEISWPDQL